MMRALIAREIRRALAGAAWLPVAFFLLVATIVPFAIGPDARLLARIGGGALWIAALTAALLPIERLIEPDRADGVLDQLALRGLTEEAVAAAKILGHWLTFAPLAVARRGPGLAVARARRCRRSFARSIALAIGTPALAALAVAVAALTAGLPRAGALSGLLLMPLAIPLVIFGAAATGDGGSGALKLEAAIALLIVAGAPFVTGAAIRASQDLVQRAKIAVGSNSPRDSSRTAISPHSTVPPRSAEQLRHQLADRQRRHPHRIDRQHQEAAILVEQAPAIGQQWRQMLLKPPHLALGPAPELGRVEQDAVVAPLAPHFARGELGRIVDDPAQRPPFHSRQQGIRPRALDRFLRRVDMDDLRARLAQQQAADAGVAEQVEHFGAVGLLAHPVPLRRHVGEEAEVAERRQRGGEFDPVARQRPAAPAPAGAGPSARRLPRPTPA